MTNNTTDVQVCACCNSPLCFQWSDTHGVGVCTTCGLPYTILHYEGEGSDSRRVEKPPSPAITDEGIEIAKRYWAENKRRVYPAAYDIGMGRNGYSYSGASPGDCSAFSEWYNREYPKQETASA